MIRRKKNRTDAELTPDEQAERDTVRELFATPVSPKGDRWVSRWTPPSWDTTPGTEETPSA